MPFKITVYFIYYQINNIVKHIAKFSLYVLKVLTQVNVIFGLVARDFENVSKSTFSL